MLSIISTPIQTLTNSFRRIIEVFAQLSSHGEGMMYEEILPTFRADWRRFVDFHVGHHGGGGVSRL